VVAPDGAVADAVVTWQVDTPPATFTVGRPSGFHPAGSSLEVIAEGLLPLESYRILIAGQLVATGQASDHGTIDRLVTIPAATPHGSRPLVVFGATAMRAGRTHIRVVEPVARSTVSSWWGHRPMGLLT
jgi:hypothetical protein